MLTTLNKILPAARRAHRAVGAFNFYNLETAQAIVGAAIACKQPVVLQTSQGALEYGGLEYLAGIAHVAAECAGKVPVVIHLDHGTDAALVERVIKSGWYTSVMIDASREKFETNIRITKRIVEMAHTRGMSVEAELGPVGGVEDALRVSQRAAHLTDPAQVKQFVAETNCDALAVNIGMAHGAVKYAPNERPQLDLKRLEQIAVQTHVPLVLHGASSLPHEVLTNLHAQCKRVGDCARAHDAVGVPIAQIKKAIARGVTKINVDTDLRLAFTAALRTALFKNKETINPRDFLTPARTAMQKEVQKKITAFARV